tara:strand:+ start:11920 stop:12252 length:333 start_codon:yes stop_codon:yes gene_type:complete
MATGFALVFIRKSRGALAVKVNNVTQNLTCIIVQYDFPTPSITLSNDLQSAQPCPFDLEITIALLGQNPQNRRGYVLRQSRKRHQPNGGTDNQACQKSSAIHLANRPFRF